MKQTIVVMLRSHDNRVYFGPFTDGEEATRWGYVHCEGYEWHWEDLWPVGEPVKETSND